MPSAQATARHPKLNIVYMHHSIGFSAHGIRHNHHYVLRHHPFEDAGLAPIAKLV